MARIAESLFDLEKYLRSNKVNPMTLEEANIVMECKSRAMRDFVISTATSAIVTWLATRKLGTINRIFVSAGAAGGLGLWWFGRSLDSSVDRILSMEGKRIKDEMSKIILMRYRDNPSVMQRVSKHFYSEDVYDDSSLDRPKLRWRVRTVFSDPVAFEKMKTHAVDPDNDIPSKEWTTAAGKIKTLREQNYIRTTMDSIVDPFDCVFGLPQPMKENHQPGDSSVPPAQGTRSQRRSHRRHRKRRQRVSEDEAILA